MKELVDVLQSQLSGEVVVSDDVLAAFATDASPYRLRPQMVVYPRHERDVRRLLRYLTNLKAKGHYLPLTPRGGGSDLMGASLGSGVILANQAHLNDVLEYDTRRGVFMVQPGLTLRAFNQVLLTQYRFFPPTPASEHYATIGGAVANNAGSYYSQKYGLTLDYVQSLRLVLATGDVLEVKPLDRRQSQAKLRLPGIEGRIYRGLAQLLSERRFALASRRAGCQPSYNLRGVYQDNQTFNLLPLFVGSQGTLGVVTAVELRTRNLNPQPLAAIIRCPDMARAVTITKAIRPLGPAAVEMIDGQTLVRLKRLAPSLISDNQLNKVNVLLLVEFDDRPGRARRALRKTVKICQGNQADWRLIVANDQRQDLIKIREAVSYLISDSSSQGRHLPGLEDARLPLDRLAGFYSEAQRLFQNQKTSFMAWGHLGLGQLSVMPKINLGTAAGRRLWRQLLADYLKLVRDHNGFSSFCHNVGRGRAEFIKAELGADLYQLNLDIKRLFDPDNLLNPGVRFPIADDKASLRSDYSLGQFCAQPPHF